VSRALRLRLTSLRMTGLDNSSKDAIPVIKAKTTKARRSSGTKAKSKAAPAVAKQAGALRLTLPATSANLGPAFDAAALAFDITFKISAKPAAEYSIAASGRDVAICRELKNNLIIQTYEDLLRARGRDVVPLAFAIQNEIPIGKGCGSSAAARLAGIAFAVHFGRIPWGDGEIIAEAARLEHHPDNAAACWVGGVAVARMNGNQVQAVKITPKGKWPLLLAVPAEKLSTEEARGVLPEMYSRADAVANIQNSMLLLTAFTEGYQGLLAGALQDRIHQPYRSKLCPLLPALQTLTGQVGILGVALSGAGPSVLLFLDPAVSAARTRDSVEAFLKAERLSGELLITSIAKDGAVRGKA
jgi:homoserine kinase